MVVYEQKSKHPKKADPTGDYSGILEQTGEPKGMEPRGYPYKKSKDREPPARRKAYNFASMVGQP